MSNRLPVPPELLKLIEKRETSDRRQGPRREDENRQQQQTGDAVPSAANDNLANEESEPSGSQQERRISSDRRRTPRRQDET